MAEIWVSEKCDVCGKRIVDGDRAILEAEVKTTGHRTYGNWLGGKGSGLLRVNFFANSNRKL